MQEMIFQVEFLSDIVLQATSNTEGKVSQLDFIPGSNFLGMAACEYEKYENSFNVFHSGALRFGDATLLCGEALTYKTPLSFFHEKLQKEPIFNHHQIKDFTQYTQLKQLRDGYITADLQFVEVDYGYAQKSAYDKENRRSKDSSMFGYSAIKRGAKWQFSVSFDSTLLQSDIERVKANLLGIKRLGKSKSAQYGEVRITQKGMAEDIQTFKQEDETILYTNSRLALVDDEGNATYDLKYLVEGLKYENIVYEKTQLRTSTFTPYNSKRETNEYERLCINKGSVIVLKNISQAQLDELQKGVGVYLSEGFGELLINPSFLLPKELILKEAEVSSKGEQRVAPKSDLALFLQTRQNAKERRLVLANKVQEFITKNKDVYDTKMNSQWGTIRSLCMTSQDIYAAVKEYISSGIAKEKWEGKKRTALLEAIKDSSMPREFTKLLAMQMPKEKIAKERQDDEK